ncbi:MAG: hypothetical protein C0511_17065 [Hyphomicrobium sp.]|nr:hypothetical protein [Hyphomicrobium sp.]
MLRFRALTSQSRTRAAISAALFLFVLWIAHSLGALELEAKMREDKLWLEIGGTEHAITIEIAETAEEKSLGLMFRTHLDGDRGMLFPHGANQDVSMWMKNTYISLDMVFIRADGVIHRIEARTEPLSERIIASDGPVSAVLELAAGTADRLGLKPGHRVRHPLLGKKAKAP